MAAVWPTPVKDGWFDEAASGNARRRLVIAIAVSTLLHSLAVFTVRAGLGAGSTSGQGIVLTARLLPLEHGEVRLPDMTAQPEVEPVRSMSRPQPELPATLPRSPSSPPSESSSAAPQRPEASGTLPLDFVRKNYYYMANRLSPEPRVLGDIPFEYPRDSVLRDGVVQAKVLISVTGSVDDVIVEASDPAGVFDAVAVQSLLKARFSPGMLHNAPVASQLLMEVRYRDPGSSTMPGVSISVKGRSLQ